MKPDAANPRRIKSDEFIRELAANIKVHGILAPIIVDSEGVIIAGENRYRAAKMAGLKEVPVIVKEQEGAERLAVQLSENMARHDMNPVDAALAIKRLVDADGKPGAQRRVAEMIGTSEHNVSKHMKLLELPTDLQENVKSGKLSAHIARMASANPNMVGIVRKFGKTATNATLETAYSLIALGHDPETVEDVLNLPISQGEKRRLLEARKPSSQLHRNLSLGQKLCEALDDAAALLEKVGELAPIQAHRVALSYANFMDVAETGRGEDAEMKNLKLKGGESRMNTQLFKQLIEKELDKTERTQELELFALRIQCAALESAIGKTKPEKREKKDKRKSPSMAPRRYGGFDCLICGTHNEWAKSPRQRFCDKKVKPECRKEFYRRKKEAKKKGQETDIEKLIA